MGWLPRPRRQGRWSIVTVTLDRNVEQFIATPRQLFINGQWVDAASGRTFETPNPATGETLARVAEGDAEDINRAVSAARAAFETGPWSRMTPSDRGRIIWRIGDLILEHTGRARPARVAGQRQAVRRGPGRGRAAGRGPVPLHGRLGHQDRGQHDQHLGALHARGQLPLLHAARAARRRGADHPLELPAADGRVEARPCPDHGQLRGPQAGRADPADRAAAG